VKTLRIHIADDGETLIKIAKKYHVDLEELIYHNPLIVNPAVHIRGMQVNLPPFSLESRNPVTNAHSAAPQYPPPWIPLVSLEQMAETEYDVLIVGTGAGGGAVIWRLCEQWGKNEKRIGIIEAGDLLIPTHRDNIPTASFTGAIWSDPEVVVDIGKILPEFSGAKKILGLGGRTLQWGTASPRMPQSELEDWPVTAKELEVYYNIAEEVMNVTLLHSKDSALQKAVLERLRENGFPEATTAPAAVDHDPKKRVPSYGAFSSILFLALGLIYKPFDLAVKTRAVQVLTEQGKTVGLKVISTDKRSYALRAKTVVLSTSTLETPRILLHSGIPGRAIGHYLQPHAFIHGVGIVNINELWNGLGGVSVWVPQTDDRPYGIHMWGGGSKESPLEAEREIGMNFFGAIEPRFENKVMLTPGDLDDYGVPRIRVAFSYSEKDQAVIRQMLDGVNKAALAMQARLSSKELMPPGSDYHESGTCRMGDDPLTSATDRYGQIHGVSGLYVADNSVIPTLGGTSPTLTTVALAIRTADHIIQRSNV